MKASTKSWLIPAGLIALGMLPAVGGTVLLTELTRGAEITPDNARFFADPAPVVVHIFSSLTFFVLGAFQFSPGFRSRKPAWHRNAGRVLVPAGLASALSGIWMALLYPPVFGDGTALTLIRTLVGSAMVLFIGLAVAAIRRRDVVRHRAWITRAYALGIAAGTQPFTLVPMLFASPALQELTYTAGLAAGWLINITVAEWILRRPALRAV